MPKILINGPEGRLEGHYHPSSRPHAPLALLLHPNPQQGGTMNNRIIYAMQRTFSRYGFAVLRFNYRGVGRSEGQFSQGEGELSDAAAVLDWMRQVHPHSNQCWIGGFSFGAWIGMQLLMRRPDIERFICIAPPAHQHDFTFLAPCPSSGLIIHGTLDRAVPEPSVAKLVMRLNQQKDIDVDYKIVPEANHFFAQGEEKLCVYLDQYIQENLTKPVAAVA